MKASKHVPQAIPDARYRLFKYLTPQPVISQAWVNTLRMHRGIKES